MSTTSIAPVQAAILLRKKFKVSPRVALSAAKFLLSASIEYRARYRGLLSVWTLKSMAHLYDTMPKPL